MQISSLILARSGKEDEYDFKGVRIEFPQCGNFQEVKIKFQKFINVA